MGDAYVGNFAMLDDFYKGTEARICVPNPNVEKGMELEHCKQGNFRSTFTTLNYNVETWPKQEWEFVVSPCEDRLPQYPCR